MKRKTTTIRIPVMLRNQIKKHLKQNGVKLEAWTEVQLSNNLRAEKAALAIIN